MKVNNACAALAALGLPWIATAMPAMADVKDYEFELVAKRGEERRGADVAVRLLNKTTGKPVPDAVIFAKRIDMAPDGMATMAPTIEQLPSTEPGVYRFKTNLSMGAAGNCRSARKCKARPARSKASWSSRPLP